MDHVFAIMSKNIIKSKSIESFSYFFFQKFYEFLFFKFKYMIYFE